MWRICVHSETIDEICGRSVKVEPRWKKKSYTTQAHNNTLRLGSHAYKIQECMYISDLHLCRHRFGGVHTYLLPSVEPQASKSYSNSDHITTSLLYPTLPHLSSYKNVTEQKNTSCMQIGEREHRSMKRWYKHRDIMPEEENTNARLNAD